jgi:hypothetical protein
MDETGDAHGTPRYRAAIRRVRRTAAEAVSDNSPVTSPLSGIAVEKRRQLAATLGLFAMLFIAVGAVAATGVTTAAIKAFVVVALLVAVFLGLMGWGVLRSVQLDLADRKLDAAIEAAVRAGGRSMCDCGIEHDPDEMHFVDGEGQHVSGKSFGCAHDGTGSDCSHSCDTCVLATMRPSPHATRVERLSANAAPATAGYKDGVVPSRP